MLPQSQTRKKRNSSKVNLMISFAFHALIVVVALYFAARQGLLGKQMKKISIEMVKAKPPEKPKEPEKPKVEVPKVEASKPEPPKVVEEAKAAPPPVSGPPTVAPPAAELPSFEFEGGKAVETSSDPVHLYKGYLEYALRSKWQRPENIEDDKYVAEVAVTVDRQGQISNPVWEKGSGDTKWDDSVKEVFKAVKSMDRPPPTNFPPRVTVRFDVQAETEPVLQ
jgi:outer membrane biosynthesis protein TonB